MEKRDSVVLEIHNMSQNAVQVFIGEETRKEKGNNNILDAINKLEEKENI